ncbi:MAG: hypothetical protein Q7J80_17930, partial [Anaerolineales bacterium]|nr:hypothetical protein [Anaerolineales bacterium]
MSVKTRAERSESQDWFHIAALGEQLRSENSLSTQRDRIASMTGRLIEGVVEVWLEEKFFRLPDWEAGSIFPPQPTLAGMKLAFKAGKLITQSKSIKNSASHATFAAIPLEDQGITLGILQITRRKGPGFSTAELNLLQSLAQIISVSLFASHRTEVEQFRLRQLNLVREVSSQIANVLNLDELAARVTELIQKTFHYYYVAIFTLDSNSNALRFRSSAGVPRNGKKKAAIALEVEMGQGLIGESA